MDTGFTNHRYATGIERTNDCRCHGLCSPRQHNHRDVCHDNGHCAGRTTDAPLSRNSRVYQRRPATEPGSRNWRNVRVLHRRPNLERNHQLYRWQLSVAVADGVDLLSAHCELSLSEESRDSSSCVNSLTASRKCPSTGEGSFRCLRRNFSYSSRPLSNACS